MGIKTLKAHALKPAIGTLKNLPTTWGLRPNELLWLFR